MIRAAVDEEGRAATLSIESLDLGSQGSRGSVRQGKEDDVVLSQPLGLRGLDHSLCQRAEMGVVLPQERAGRACGRQGTDLNIGVGGQEAKNLSAGVSRRTGDGCCPGHTETIRPTAYKYESDGVGPPSPSSHLSWRQSRQDYSWPDVKLAAIVPAHWRAASKSR